MSSFPVCLIPAFKAERFQSRFSLLVTEVHRGLGGCGDVLVCLVIWDQDYILSGRVCGPGRLCGLGRLCSLGRLCGLGLCDLERLCGPG